MNRFNICALLIAALALVGGGSAALSETPRCPPGVPEGVACGGKDPSAATSGTYQIDAAHSSVIARVSHLGYSFSTFRFGEVAGRLAWNAAQPERSQLTVTVGTASIQTPVKGFADELAGEKFLQSARYPEATFVSTRFRRSGPTRGFVDGRFTLMGKSQPATFEVDLVGAGRGFGKPRIGVQARTRIQPQLFGLPPSMNSPIELVIDAEFERQP